MFLCILLLSVVSGGLVYLYFILKEKHKYFEKLAIPFKEPKFLVGNSWESLAGKENINVYLTRMYNEFPGEKLFGIYHGFVPIIILRDPELIATVLTKEFRNFSDRGIPFNEESNPLEGHLFNIGGYKWKILRSKLSPTFTSGRIKAMLSLMETCVDVFLQDLEKNQGKEIDFKIEFTKLTSHVIGSCTFGIETDSIRNENSDFTKLGTQIIQPNTKGFILSIIRFLFPKLDEKLKFRIIPKEVNDFFFALVKESMDYRKKTGYSRNDFLQLLLELREKGEVSVASETGKTDDDHDLHTETTETLVLTDAVLTAQAAVFLAAGFETTSSTLGFLFYMLSKHKDIQEKLRNEIRAVKQKHNAFTYEALKEMHYLDAVINETLRMWPPVGNLLRKCLKTTTIAGVTIEKGISVSIPNEALQKDAKYFPEPNVFRPERFIESTPQSYTFLPFGGGPRNCIGERFARLETKLTAAKLVDTFEIDTCPKMLSIEPVKYKTSAFINIPSDGLFCVLTKL